MAEVFYLKIPGRLMKYCVIRNHDPIENMPQAIDLFRKRWGGKVKFRFPNLVKSVTQPYIVTELPLLDPEIEKRINELDEILYEGNETGRVHKALGWRSWRWRRLYDGEHHTEKSNRDDFRRQIAEINSDPTMKSAVSPRFSFGDMRERSICDFWSFLGRLRMTPLLRRMKSADELVAA